MILLASTSDLLRLTTSAASTIQVATSWRDLDAGVVSRDRQNTSITTATTTDIVPSPGSGVYRSVAMVSIRNTDAAMPCTVTVIHRATATDVELLSVHLNPSDSLTWTEHDAWRYMRNPFGTLSSAHDRVWLDPAIGAVYTQVLPADIVNANATANRLIDVMDLQFAVRQGHCYWFCYTLMYTAALITTGSRWTIYGHGSTTAIRYLSEYPVSATAKTNNEGNAAYDIPAAANAGSGATGSNIATIEGFIDTPTCDGVVYPRFASEILSSAITLKRGSRLEWQRVT